MNTQGEIIDVHQKQQEGQDGTLWDTRKNAGGMTCDMSTITLWDELF